MSDGKPLSSPLRVLELRSASDQGGGPERSILDAAALGETLLVSETLCFLRREGAPPFLAHSRAQEMGLPSFVLEERRAMDHRTLGRLRALVREHRIQIVHSHDYKADLLAFLLARVEPIVLIATAHGWPVRTLREQLLYYPVDQRMLRSFALVIAVSKEIRGKLLRRGARPERVRYLPNAVDTQALTVEAGVRARIRDHWGVDDKERVLGTVGRLEAEKRPDLILRIFASLCQRFSDIRLVMAGAGPMSATLENEARSLGVEDRCLFLGHRSDIEAVYQGFDLFIQASDYEGFPFAVLDAMALEVPLAVTGVGGTADLIEDGAHGLVVPAESPEVLERAINQILQDPKASRQRALAARQRVVEEFSLESRQRQVVDLLRGLVPPDARAGE